MSIWKLPFAALLALAALSRQSPSSAGNPPPNTERRRPRKRPKGAPVPVAGAGLPLLAVTAGAYWVIRRRMIRAKEQA
jgi:hypothetical protein